MASGGRGVLDMDNTPRHRGDVQEQNPPTFHPTVWPAEPPVVPEVPLWNLETTPDGRLRVTDVNREVSAVALPPDFVLRELLEAPPEGPGLVEFMQRWGLLLKVTLDDQGYIDLRRAGRNLLRMQSAARHFIAGWQGDEAAEQEAWAVFARLGEWEPPSLTQARLWFQATLNEALTVFAVHVRFPHDEPSLPQPLPNLYNACALQLARYLASELTVNRCANERCRNVFTVQRGGARSDYGQHRSRGVRYCSPLCAKAQSERDRRRRRSKEAGQS